MAMSRSQFGAALGMVTLAPTVFAFSGETILDKREKAKDPAARAYMRQANIIGAITVVGLGVAVGLVIGDDDWYTVGGAVLGAAAMVALNEYALRNPKQEPDPKEKGQVAVLTMA